MLWSADTNTPFLPDVVAVNGVVKTSSNGVVKTSSNGVVRPRRLSSAKISAQCPKKKLAPHVIQVRTEMLDSHANLRRHQPIYDWMFQYDGIRPISSWVNTFKKYLYPWGGPYRFERGTTHENGPVNWAYAG